jgi:dihydroorotase
MDCELLLSGGELLDAGQGLEGRYDVAFEGGRVQAVAPDLSSLSARERLDGGGTLVVPGLIDLHTHIYHGATPLGVKASLLLEQSGATTLVDAGSAGAGNFAGWEEFIAAKSPARLFAFLNIAYSGIHAFGQDVRFGEAADLRLLHVESCLKMARRHSELIRGIKVRLGLHGSGAEGIYPLQPALEAAQGAGLPLMVHIDHPPPSLPRVLSRLRPGDILTHCLRPLPQEDPSTIEQEIAALIEAQERGVILDVAHGLGSFSFRHARALLAAGVLPDVISSDLHRFSLHGPAKTLLHTMSKFLALGLSLPQVFSRVTCHPARALKTPQLGTLAPGSPGDATLLALEQGSFSLEDTTGEQIQASQRFVLRGIVRQGQLYQPAQPPSLKGKS